MCYVLQSFFTLISSVRSLSTMMSTTSSHLVSAVALLVARRTNNRKVVGSRPTKVVCVTVLTGNRLGWTVRCGRPPFLLPSCRKLEFGLSALMDSDLAWVNGKSGRQSWCYADAFQRCIISEAIYHLPFTCCVVLRTVLFRDFLQFELRQLQVFDYLDRIIQPRKINNVHRVADCVHSSPHTHVYYWYK